MTNERHQQEKCALEKTLSDEVFRVTQQLEFAKRDLCQHKEEQSRQDNRFESLQKDFDNALLTVCQSETAHAAEMQAKDEQLRDTTTKLNSALEKIILLEANISALEEKVFQGVKICQIDHFWPNSPLVEVDEKAFLFLHDLISHKQQYCIFHGEVYYTGPHGFLLSTIILLLLRWKWLL
ncbi:unnamed protein product [Dibothriocephalus latus]|uniref:Uncharacterized protein n=1 Tax=Dibothriocephalus latus TaxID=60516 RepID=A0A3P7NER1_DIBLA|nr:unnamed protein product [Dibothriocephalus latus]